MTDISVSDKNPEGSYAAVKGEELPDAPRTACCTISGTRRLFRIVFLMAVVAVLVLGPVVIIKMLYTYKTVTVDNDKPFKFALTNCKLYIAETAEVPVSSVEMVLDIPGKLCAMHFNRIFK